MKNAWAIGGILQPTMTPGWAVGFYFIPIALIWKPFQGMSQIWSATFEGQGSRGLGCVKLGKQLLMRAQKKRELWMGLPFVPWCVPY